MTIEKLFAILKDGEWHNLTDLAGQIKVQTDKLTEFLQFASKQDVIAYEDKNHRIKIKPEWQNTLPDEIEPTLALRSSRRKKKPKFNPPRPATPAKSSKKSPQKSTTKPKK